MIITISATLSIEEVNIISTLKGYSQMIPVGPWEPEIENPQSREDFVRQVYESMIKEDAKSVFLSYAKLQRQEQELIEAEQISNTINSAISSKVE